MRQTALRVTQRAISASLIFTERQRFCVVHCHLFLPGYNKLKKGTALQKPAAAIIHAYLNAK